jgi:hypothetical protein
MRRILAVVVLATACSGSADTKKRPEMTQRQRDSAIGESRLPGAQGVRGALKAQDSAQARNTRLDSIDP